MQAHSLPTSAFDINLNDAYSELRSGRHDTAAMLMAQCREMAQRNQDPVDLARVDLLQGLDMAMQGKSRESLQLMLPAVSVVEGSEQRHDLISAYASVGTSMGLLGDPGRGLHWVARAVALAQLMQSPEGLARARMNQAVMLNILGEHAKAIDTLQQTVHLAQEQGLTTLETTGWLNLTHFAIRWHDSCKSRHDTEGATQSLAQALRFGQLAVVAGGKQQRVRSLALAHCNLAQAQVRSKDYLAAQASFGAALALAPHDAEMVAEIKLFQAIAAREQGQADRARDLLDEGLRYATETGIDTMLHALLLEYSELEQEQGRLAEAFARYRQRHELMVAHYERRLSATAQSVETLVEAEMARFNAAAAEQRESALRIRHAELSRQAEHWEKAALQDPLTQTLNRRGFYQMAQRLFVPGKAPAVVLLDLDHFKQVNDVHGHAVGDRVLQAFVHCVNQHCREVDVLARHGGEEFVLLLSHETEAQALAHCERLRQAVADHDWGQISPGLKVTASLGLALRADVNSVDVLLALADAALYQAKGDGRNCVRLATYTKLAELQT